MSAVRIELPSAAQKHRAMVEKAAFKLAAGDPPRRAFAAVGLAKISGTERTGLMAAATVRANELIARNCRRVRIMGIAWCACGLIPLLYFTLAWFRHGNWNLVLLILGIPALLNGIRILGTIRKPPLIRR